MDFDNIVVKESPGLCRCCLSEGCYKDLSTEYTWMDDTEIYADMLLDCFDISISQHNEGPNGPNRLICEVCVTRLRDACNFKKQVLASEKKFVDMIGRGGFKPKVTYNVPIKSETILEVQPLETEVEYLDEGMDFGDDVLKDDITAQTSTENFTITTFPIKGKKGKAKKTVTKTEKKACSKVVLVEKPKVSKPVTKGCTEEKETRENVSKPNDKHKVWLHSVQKQQSYTTEEKRKIMKNNVKELLLNSTLVPFRWLREFYRCFFCEKVFETPKEWKSHQTKHDIKKELNVALNNYFLSIVNVDVTDIKCTLCFDSFSEVHKLIDHLIDKHKIDYNSRVNCIDGYTFDDNFIFCLKCDKGFSTFSQIFIHNSKEHPHAEYLCDICGQSYTTINYLQNHIKSQHRNGVKCSKCSLFLPFTRLRTHMEKFHELMYLSKLDDRLETRIKKDEMAKLLVIILENSTIMPFRWYSNKYMCFYCCYDFVDSKQLKEHTKEEHAELNSYNVLRSLLKNARVKLDVSEIACKKCPKVIDNFDDFLEHATKAHEITYDKSVTKHFFCFKLSDDAMGCIDCGLQFRFFGPLLTHVHKHHNKIANKFLCEICGQSFIAKVNVQSHMKNVHGSYNGRKCEKCGKSFTSNYALNQHSMKEHKTDRLKCPKCPEVLGSRYLKKRHLALVHDEKSSQFACELCPRVYLAKSALVTHNLRVHVQEKSFTCEICGYKSFDKENLQRHMVKHDDSRPFECEFCKKSFQRKKTLEFHRRIHTNDKRYVCSECGKAFVQSTSLKIHLRVHHSIVRDKK